LYQHAAALHEKATPAIAGQHFILVTTADEFNDAILNNFSQPIFVPADSPLAKSWSQNSESWTIEKAQELEHAPDTEISVQLMAGEPYTTIPMKWSDFIKRIFSGKPEDTMNGLDIAPLGHTPRRILPIRANDPLVLSRHIKDGSLGRRLRSTKWKEMDAFMLMSSGGVHSPSHQDGQGVDTWVTSEAGWKRWYFQSLPLTE